MWGSVAMQTGVQIELGRKILLLLGLLEHCLGSKTHLFCIIKTLFARSNHCFNVFQPSDVKPKWDLSYKVVHNVA